jgi:hypothetical protein
MLMQEIFDQLSSGELVQTNLGEIDEKKWPRVVMHVNLGLADLFKRFFLREGRVMIKLLPGQVVYPIDMKFAVNNKHSRIVTEKRFIMDSPEAPFINDILAVDSVLTEGGVNLDLTDDANKWALSVSDTYPPTLRVPLGIVEQDRDLPDDLKTSQLEVIYRARHPKIDPAAASFDPETYDVRLPDTHLQALLYYVASRVYQPLGTGQFEGMNGANYWKRYDAECEKLTDAGVQLDRGTGFDKLRSRGYA